MIAEMFLQFLYFIIIFLHTEVWTFKTGEPRACFVNKEDKPLMMEVLPGFGWDNLMNENRGIVVNFNYSKCKTTEDGRYLLPDGVVTIPVKTSQINIFSQVFDHWSQYESDTAFSINTGGPARILSIAGSFSYESHDVKRHQLEDKTITTKVQARCVRYTAKVLPDVQLDQSFHNRLLKIADHIQHKRKLSCKYESELLVRDFGTHVLTSVDAGASIVKVDQVESSLLNNTNKILIKLAASASFPIFNTSLNLHRPSSSADIKKYIKSIKNSEIKTYGGQPIDLESLTLGKWISTIGNDLVAVDRNGFPLDYIISPTTLPDLPASIVEGIVQSVRKAIVSYFEHNTYPGCTNPGAPNFSKQANFDDGSCHEPFANFSFGGVYQECVQETPPIDNENLCDELMSKNPQTKGFSCPEGFEKIFLHTGITKKIQIKHECEEHWFRAETWKDISFTAAAKYTSYWCQPKPNFKGQENNGFLFGGLYSDTTNNFVSQTKSCSQYYYPLRIASDIKVCVSDDYELGTKFAVPFGGFYSCQSGNPLNSGKKSCPKGFNNHLASIVDDCEIQYCVQSGQLTHLKYPTVMLPPFSKVPAESFEAKTNYIVSHDLKTRVQIIDSSIGKKSPIESKWKPLSSAPNITEMLSNEKPLSHVTKLNDESVMSNGIVAALSVILTAIVCIIIGVCIYCICSRKARKPDGHNLNEYTHLGYSSREVESKT
ncbi:macrophage-expressed gene 1 protein-like [Crassostrea angulata]|uniref:macrophage-expressed gene 1 protein-like n=1 Tax=Magallana angulata TaxID=2784310 RepID=UPI0022B17BA0|nr:macrophage-expressed gene 1 protein-like [Crassostrea angulata]